MQQLSFSLQSVSRISFFPSHIDVLIASHFLVCGVVRCGAELEKKKQVTRHVRLSLCHARRKLATTRLRRGASSLPCSRRLSGRQQREVEGVLLQTAGNAWRPRLAPLLVMPQLRSKCQQEHVKHM